MPSKKPAPLQLDPGSKTDAKLRETRTVLAVLHSHNRDKFGATDALAELPEPDVMHRNLAGKRQGTCQQIPAESHTATQVTVVIKIFPEAAAGFQLFKYRRAYLPLILIDYRRIKYDKQGTGRIPCKDTSNNLKLIR